MKQFMYGIFRKPTEDEIQNGTHEDIPIAGSIHYKPYRCWEWLTARYALTQESLEKEGYFIRAVTVIYDPKSAIDKAKN